ncbi:glycosyltransferase family 4 protein [Desulfovibrio sp. OttesenSCG-928-I05]|nr:glycosyltransferase family 4 protein [Desulfovibrio sp. OttesenSCG-928-I05]
MASKRIWASLHPFFEGGGILGRGVANAEFLTALLQADPFAAYHFFLQDQAQADALTARLAERFPALAARGAFMVGTRFDLPAALARHEYACFHLSDYVADTVPLMRLRNALCTSRAGDGGSGCAGKFFPVTGPTHSLSYARYAPFFFGLLWEGVSPGDAMIVTSRAARDAMSRYFAAFREGYALDQAAFPEPGLELIPLGVNPAAFPAPGEKGALGASMREELGLRRDELVLLVFARISHYSKMDILPLFRALIRAQAQGLPHGGYTLVMAGWVEDGDTMPDTYRTLAANLGIRLLVVPSPPDAVRKKLFAAADIFLSPVDNPQETFGLSLLEAGVSSLPVVASDFDGYRDIIIDGETGFLAPTLGPAHTPESDALSGIWFDNQYHLQLAQQSVVDVPRLAAAIARLAGDVALRERMGANARERVTGGFTWEHCVERHCALWEALARKAERAGPSGRAGHTDPALVAGHAGHTGTHRHPLFPAYPRIFGGYYSELLSSEAANAISVRWSEAGEAVYRGRDFPVVYAGVERLVPLDALKKLLFRARKPVPLAALLPAMDGESAGYEHAAFLVLWALKQDLLERVS